MPTVNLGFEEFLEDNVKELIDKADWMKDVDMQLCADLDVTKGSSIKRDGMDYLRSFIDEAIKNEVCALDLETTGLSTRVFKGVPACKIVGISLAYNSKSGLYVAINHKEGSEYNLPEKLVLDEIKRLCSNCTIVVHNSKFDLQNLKNHGVVVDRFDRFEDTQIMARLFDAGRKDIKLKNLSNDLLQRKMVQFEEVTGGSHRFDMISPRNGYVYATSDAINTFALYEFFKKSQLIQDQKKIYEIEKKTVFVVMQMEANLIKIDKAYLETEKVRISARLIEIEKEVYKLAKKEFLISSTQQLGRVLFDEGELNYHYPEKEKTKSGQYMTDTATLEKIQDRYPLVKLIIEYRELQKSLNTYVENLIKNCDADNCIKLGFKQTGTDTGRFSSPGGRGLLEDGYCGVNVQSIPSNYSADAPDVRKAFIARPGYKIVAMDFSGEELRVATNLSKEKKWVDEFLYGDADLHTSTGKIIFKKDVLTKAERQQAKTVNFLVMYGGGPRGLAEQAKMTEQEARRVLTAFFEGLPQLRGWMDNERKLARKQKYARTAFGRIRPLGMFYDTGDRGQEAHADRCAVNFLIQGSCADLMKIVMVRVHGWILSNNLQDDIKILITMHDELVFEIKEDKLDLYIPQINNIMALTDILQGDILKWPVPLVVDAEYGDTWHVDHDFFKEKPELKTLKEPIKFLSSTQVVETPVEPVRASVELEEPALVAQASVEPPLAPESPPEFPPSKIKFQLIEDQPDPVPEGQGFSGEFFTYIVKDRRKSTIRRLNNIIMFLRDEVENNYSSDVIKIIKVCDKENHILSVSDIKINIESFLVLARYEGV